MFNLTLLTAVMLAAALLVCVPGAPLKDAPTDLPPVEISGDEEEKVQSTTSQPDTLKNLMNTWKQVLASTKRHKNEFEDEFRGNVVYHSLNCSKCPNVPAECKQSNFSKDACLQKLAEGLLVYSVLLKHVDKEYHSSSIVIELKATISLLITQIKLKMGNADCVAALTSSQEQQLLKELNSPDLFHRKKTAHSILQSMHIFLLDGKRSFFKWEIQKKQSVHMKWTQTSNPKAD